MSTFKSIDVETLKSKLDCNEDFTLIDVRENQELEICKLEEAIHIPVSSVPVYLNEIDFKKPVVIMCKSGGRSAQICQFLNDQGHFDVYNLNGGIISWALEIDSTMATY